MNGTANWPDPFANPNSVGQDCTNSNASCPERIDDLWHAAVNGRGIYYNAVDASVIASSISNALAAVTSRAGSSAAAATSNLEPVAGDNYLFVALYRTVFWDGDLQARTIDDAYDRYYRHDINSATLDAFGAMLEKLARGELLQPASLQRLYAAMKLGTFTNHRLQAGLPRSEPFIHKTGTQYRRACHAGVLRPQDRGADAVVVAVCAAGMDEHKDVDAIFQQVGRAVAQTALRPEQSAAR